MSDNESNVFYNFYAETNEPINAMFALIDTDATNGANDNMDFLPAIQNTNPEYSVHNPETRTVFQELRNKVQDIESIYMKGEFMDHDIIPTTETIRHKQQLEENIKFFKDKIRLYFMKFVQSNIQCEKEEAFLSQCLSLLDVVQNSSLEDSDFNKCAQDICKSLESFTEKLSRKKSKSIENKDAYWNQYKEYRNHCKLVREVQSDVICQICMSQEVNMAINCGHCFCTQCASQCNVCPNCRISVTQRLKLFF